MVDNIIYLFPDLDEIVRELTKLILNYPSLVHEKGINKVYFLCGRGLFKGKPIEMILYLLLKQPDLTTAALVKYFIDKYEFDEVCRMAEEDIYLTKKTPSDEIKYLLSKIKLKR